MRTGCMCASRQSGISLKSIDRFRCGSYLIRQLDERATRDLKGRIIAPTDN